MKRPVLVATLGPASFELVSELRNAGADAFRLNGSHMSAQELRRVMCEVRRVTDAPVIVDLKGAKMRLGAFECRQLHRGMSLALVFSDSLDCVGDGLPLPHFELFRGAKPGDTLSCDDDRVHLRVESVSPKRIVVTSLCDAVLYPYKGVNVVEHPVELEGLTQIDCSQIDAVSGDDVSFAFSFMRDGREAAWVRDRAAASAYRRGSRIDVVGKVERAEAVANVDSVASCVDAVWVCRGDLGAQMGVVPMAQWLSAFVPTELGVPVLIAGQVFEHLTRHKDPTRSEVCHVVDLLRRGYSGVVLSDETAVGDDPVRTTSIVSEIIRLA